MLVFKQMFKSEFNSVTFQKSHVFFLERRSLVMFFLLLNVLADARYSRIANGESTIAFLPFKGTSNFGLVVHPMR
ncbi:hypothetical protein EC9_08170 [Rosistilla ulvae]|uniref:Uncharacterized protein n=1 Tax=Rosistilla ulvae TaxID=1930277 RepID=A0A517LVJ4_9BACT|nr:hypothetical protein EC9_08170 [Rosistilla ulvae]